MLFPKYFAGNELKELLIAAEVGNIDRMRNLVDAMKQWDLTDKWMTKGDRKGRTPMHLASIYGYVNVIEFLVKEVIDRIENDETREKYRNLQDYKGRSCVFYAAAEGRALIIGYLVESGSNPNLGTSENHYEPGSTPLMACAEKNEIECFDILVEKGADIAQKRDDGADAIYIAARFGHLELIRTLFERLTEEEREDEIKKIVNRPSYRGRTPLLTAALHGHVILLKEFRDHGASLDHQDDLGYTAIMYAASQGYHDIVKFLIQSGANLAKRNKFHENALKIAMLNKEFEIAKLIKTFTSNDVCDDGAEDPDIIVSDTKESKKTRGKRATTEKLPKKNLSKNMKKR